MNYSSLQPNVYSFQKDVINLLYEISDLFKDYNSVAISETLSEENKESISNFLTQSISDIEKARKNVDNLELRMAIVAPMKAGKSTIVNAIVGEEILPSRNAAMTTIPTEIILDSKLDKPELIILDNENQENEIKTIFGKAVSAIQNKIKEVGGVEKAKEKIPQYPHLHKQLEQITKIHINKYNLFDQKRTTEQKHIKTKLFYLNDIIRLCTLLSVQFNPLQSLSTIPRIKTPFFQQQHLKQKKYLGNLVIIDTPGPNEAGDNSGLLGVVRNELKRSSVVLVVLDFTQLKTIAAENVKKEVERIIEIRGNKDSLYILVNKVDQRRKDDMSPEDIQNFVVSDFGIDSSRAKDTIFEISARRAFSAAYFFKTINDNSFSLEELKKQNVVRLLAEESFGIDWEEELESADQEFLEKKANRIWEKSKFGTFIDNAINDLMTRAAPLAIEKELNHIYRLLGEIKSNSNLRKSAISKDTQKLQAEIQRLKEDIENIEKVKTELTMVKDVKDEINKYRDDILPMIHQDIKSTVEKKFIQKDYDRGNFLQQLDSKARKIFSTNIFDDELLMPDYISNILNTLSYEPKRAVGFSTKDGADKFAQESVSYCRTLIENELTKFRELFEEKVQSSYTELKSNLETKTSPIVKRATKRLGQDFDVKLEPFSSPEFRTEASGKIEIQSNPKVQTIEHTTIKKRRRWFTLWLVPMEREVTIKQSKNYYEVVLQDLVKQVNQSLNQNINNIQENTHKYLDEDIQKEIDSYFDSLNEYLSGYKKSLENAQSDQSLSIRKQAELKQKLDYIVENSTKQIRKCENYLDRVDEILPKSF
ncbi:MAG: hypothetical protein F6K54_10390 [Okeania sp. SIO3B5]|uniref:dynamin family protein n=1 Tax=Okeania sp. SIO3B5 TaxID=2607811 RepID=UPI0014005BDA|nr:dynamin family protein [Okeania sp. SIO3B5]NEO53454.1 hypothetical protein [Okeania sp. SIO3B5]